MDGMPIAARAAGQDERDGAGTHLGPVSREASPGASLAASWARCRGWILAALELAGGTHDEADIVEGIADGRYQFWPGRRSAIVTHFVEYPRLRACRFFLAGGDLEELTEMEQFVAAWAKRQGCSRMEIVGRRGWSKALRGYREVATALGRDL